jgi:hypothetical protein
MLNIRAHHLLCIPRYYSGGYNQVFAEQHKKVCMSIRKNPNQKIRILRKLDDLCARCPHNGGKVCAKKPDSNEHVMWLDSQVLRALNLKENSVHTAKDAFNLSMSKIPSVKILCKDCVTYYKSCTSVNNGTGINNSFRNDLNK